MALTQSGVLTQEFVDMLAMELLPRADDKYDFYQLGPIQHEDDLAAEPGKVILFNRPDLPTGTYTETSRRGTEATAVDAGSVALTMTQLSLTIREYLGPHDGTAIRPFGITEFMAKRAKHNLLEIIGGFLRRDRTKFLDTVIMDLLLAATTVVTPDGSAEGAIAAGQVADADWLRRWGKSMFDAKIPTYPNGRYRLWINSRQNQELLADAEFRETNRYLASQNPAFAGQVAIYDRFDIGLSTRLPTKGVGGAGAVTGYQAVAHGPLAIGHGTAMPPTPAVADDTDFGRQERVLWKSHECFGTLMTDFIQRGITT